VISLSEQVRKASLEERIKEERNNARTMSVLSIIMLIDAVIGFVSYFSDPGNWGGLFMGIVGAIGFPLFAIGERSANRRKKKLINELESMSENSNMR
jgi:multisubunit Na+/H+ antiporter MnhB subunit